jgi:hypothetical protein
MCSRKGEAEVIEIKLEPHRGMRGRCSQCQQPAPGYDRLPERRWQFVPLWGIRTDFLYAPRRLECAEHGVIVEHIPSVSRMLSSSSTNRILLPQTPVRRLRSRLSRSSKTSLTHG